MKRISQIRLIFILSFALLQVVNTHARDFNIIEFGALADTTKLSTVAINNAIKACSREGGGRVIIPTGSFKSGTIILLNNVELHFEKGATLYASLDFNDFPNQKRNTYRSEKDKWGWYAFIYAADVTNIAITGSGCIDGQGAKKKLPAFGDDRDARPKNILFISCKNVTVSNVTMKNSAMWNQHYLNCEDVFIDHITVYNHSTQNNDAIDIDGCRRLILSNSTFDSDDDGITLKSTGTAPCENITISNCIVSSYCSAIKCGTESTGGFRNIKITGCLIVPSKSNKPPIFAHGVKTGQVGIALEIVDGGVMEGVLVDNIIIDGTECPVFVRLGNRARKHIPEAKEPPIGQMRNISISNITAYNTGNFSSSITGIPGGKIENVSLHNIRITNRAGLTQKDYTNDFRQVPEKEKGFPSPDGLGILPSYGLFLRHLEQVSLANIRFRSTGNEIRKAIIADDVEQLLIDGLDTPLSKPGEAILLNNVRTFKNE